MSVRQAAVLMSESGEAVPLKGVQASGRLAGLLFEMTVEQTYENTSSRNIEAEYTFPVPHRAVLLGLELQIGARALQAVAVRRQAARENYEEAIEQGDTAALLEQAGDGLYSLSLGNLMAGERAVIRYRYAELLDRAGDEVRLAVPTVIAPRYGDAAQHGLAPHQVPGVDLLVSYPFSLTIDVMGEMAACALHSPSHRIQVTNIEGGRRVTLGAGAWLDRDFVLGVSGVATRSASVVARDGEGYVALLSLDPRITEKAAAPLALKLVVDCSGSMGGDSIECARRALLNVLDRLEERDCVSITRFGSSVEHVPIRVQAPAGGLRGLLGRREPGHREEMRRGELAAATPATVEWLRHQVRTMQADLGGTELAAALEAAIAIPAPQAAVKDILLITDAEVWAVEQVLARAAQSGHRLFVVAVGAAPAEALARQLAEKTGGACEFVSPLEDADAAIVRMFRRLREAPKRVARVAWPVAPAWEGSLPAAVFSGDTIHLLAGFDAEPAGEVRVTVTGVAEGDIELRATLGSAAAHDVLPRLAAAKRIHALDAGQAAALAERYQLASAYTSFVVVQVRDADGKATALPELAKVSQMLAAGWGGTSRVHAALDLGTPCMTMQPHGAWLPATCEAPPLARPSAVRQREAAPLQAKWRTYHLAYGRSARDWALNYGDAAGSTPREVLGALSDLLVVGAPWPASLAELAQLGVPEAVIAALRYAMAHHLTLPDVERRVVQLFIALLAKSSAGDALEDDVRKALQGTVLGERALRSLRVELARLIHSVGAEAWGELAEGVVS